MKKIQLTPAAIVTPNENGILLQSDLGSFQLHGNDISDFVHRVMPMLDKGNYDIADICEELSEYDDDSIKDILGLLRKRGIIVDVPDHVNAAPPWEAHERFLSAWSAKEKQSTSTLTNRHLLVIGLEPWSVKMVDELACCGVGHIHLVDNETITIDDILCHRNFGEQTIGHDRAETLKALLAESAPWCKVSTEKLALDEHDNFIVNKKQKWDLVIPTLPKEAQFWLIKVSHYIHAGNYPTLYGCLDGLETNIGPFVIPNETACWNCLRLRRLGTEQSQEVAHILEKSTLESQKTRRARSMLSSMAVITGQQLAMEVNKVLLRFTPCDLDSKVNVQNLVTRKSDTHTIIPMPWCDVCGQNHTLPGSPTISDKPATYAAMSAVSPYTSEKPNPLNSITTLEELKSLFSGWIDSKTGVIRQLTGHVDSLPDFPRTASAGLSSFTVGDFDPRSTGQIGSGKGLDDISAHISAIGEAIERYSAARFNVSELKYASISQLTKDYVDPESLVLYSQKQYSSPHFPFSKWKRKQKIHWAEGTWLGTEKNVFVPALTTYFNFNAPFKEQFSQVSSNGLAAGQNKNDAAMRATYELIERDAMMLTWYAQLPCQRLTFDSHYHGKMKVMIDDLQAKGVTLELYLLDVGLHVPTVVCLALGNGINVPAASVSLATHGDISVAMNKALLEQGHVMPYLCHLMTSSPKRPQHVSEVRSLEDHAAYYFSPDKLNAFNFMRQPLESAISINHWPYPPINTIDQLKQSVANAGVKVAIVDVTAPDVQHSPFNVARAIGVHMQPIHFGEQFKRVDNPRLRKHLQGRAVNINPHPIA